MTKTISRFSAIAVCAASVLFGSALFATPVFAQSGFDSGWYQRLSTDFRGHRMNLDVFNGGDFNNVASLHRRGDVSGQYWFVSRDNGDWYRLSTMFLSENMCLDITNGGERNNIAHLAPCGNYSGQYWHISDTGDGATGSQRSFEARHVPRYFNGGRFNMALWRGVGISGSAGIFAVRTSLYRVSIKQFMNDAKFVGHDDRTEI